MVGTALLVQLQRLLAYYPNFDLQVYFLSDQNCALYWLKCMAQIYPVTFPLLVVIRSNWQEAVRYTEYKLQRLENTSKSELDNTTVRLATTVGHVWMRCTSVEKSRAMNQLRASHVFLDDRDQIVQFVFYILRYSYHVLN